MRLINTKTRVLEEFIGRNIPKYAILSHTWEEEGEVTYQDVMTNPDYALMKGHEKIEMTCRLALASGLKYAWVDTCCIDKSSSAELSEAINSMYQWYERSEVCYGYLSDLKASASLEASLGESLRNCRWFTRGWTLQELIAPRNFLLYDGEWNEMGTKNELADVLSEITGIDTDILLKVTMPSAVPVARRMAWAARRDTTRIEDRAYSLLGIFGVNMPMLYGEEGKAFRRLQEEIIKSTSDLSIFAWTLPADSKPDTDEETACGLLATSPDVFAGCLLLQGRPDGEAQELLVTNSRVKTQTPMFHERRNGGGVVGRVMMLGCSLHGQYLGVRLRIYGVADYVRLDPWNFFHDDEGRNTLTPEYTVSRYVLAALPSSGSSSDNNPGFMPASSFLAERRRRVLQLWTPESGFHINRILPPGRCHNPAQLVFASSHLSQDACIMSFRVDTGARFPARIVVHGRLVVVGWGGYPDTFNKHPDPVIDRDGDGHVTRWKPSRDNALQFAVCQHGDPHEAQVHELVNQISGRENLDVHYIVDWMNRHGVPRVSSVVNGPQGGRKFAVKMFITPWIVEDRRVCKDPFWRLHFGWEVVDELGMDGVGSDETFWQAWTITQPGFGIMGGV